MVIEMGPKSDGVIYVVANNPIDDGNEVLAFRNDGDGKLSPLPGSPFKTHGAGYASPFSLPHFGPFDCDQNLVLSEDRSRLYVTNGSIAVFNVLEDGGLEAVKGSPFPSGGKNPVSIGIAGDKLYVANKNDDPGRDMTQSKPNYTGFRIGADGGLTPIPGATVELETSWRSPTQVLVVDDKFINDGDFGGFFVPERGEQWGTGIRQDRPTLIRSMRINGDGTLAQLEPIEAPPGAFDSDAKAEESDRPDPLMFGLQKHPRENLVYISYVTGDRLGVYEYDSEGRLHFVGMTSNSGKLICWVCVNKEGTRAYTTNNASNTLSIYDLSDPRKPIEIKAVDLKGDGHPYQIALSSDGNWLYVVKSRTFPQTPVGEGSVINVLRVLKGGDVEEAPDSPVKMPVRDDLLGRPLGVAAH